MHINNININNINIINIDINKVNIASLLMHIIAHKKDKQKLNVALTDHNQPPTQRLPELLYFLTKSIWTGAWILNFHIYGGDMPPLGKKFRQYTKFKRQNFITKLYFFFYRYWYNLFKHFSEEFLF